MNRVQRLEPGGVNTEPASLRLVLWGIHERSGQECGVRIGDATLTRLPGEEVEAMRIRAMRQVVPALPANALRDTKGSAVGWFIYPGLPEDHCRTVAERESQL